MSSGSKKAYSKVQVWIHCLLPKGESGERYVLLLKTRPDRGGFWQPVTGSVDEGEALDAAAGRETLEETGMTALRGPKALGFEFEFDSKWGHATESAFEIEVAPSQGALPKVKTDPSEHTEAVWVKPDEALTRLKFESNAFSLQLLMRSWKKRKS